MGIDRSNHIARLHIIRDGLGKNDRKMVRGDRGRVNMHSRHHPTVNSAITLGKFHSLSDCELSLDKSGNDGQLLEAYPEYVVHLEFTQPAHFPPLAMYLAEHAGDRAVATPVRHRHTASLRDRAVALIGVTDRHLRPIATLPQPTRGACLRLDCQRTQAHVVGVRAHLITGRDRQTDATGSSAASVRKQFGSAAVAREVRRPDRSRRPRCDRSRTIRRAS